MRRLTYLIALLLLIRFDVACTPASVTQTPTVTPAPTQPASHLDEDTLKRLTISAGPSIEIQPGDTRQLSLGTNECCYYFREVKVDAGWSIDPTNGASIEPHTGLLKVDAATPHGSVFNVTADAENGRRVVSAKVFVFTPQGNPLIGLWREEAQFECGTPTESTPEERIGELHFRADGSFSVTWHPFEVYRDYWGTYQYDRAQGTIVLKVDGGNYVPKDMDGSGRFTIDPQGRLMLADLWLGGPPGSRAAASCGHRFTR